MMGTILFHCGSAKAGSTTIQNELWAARTDLQAKGYYYCPRFVRSGNVDPLNVALRDIKWGDSASAIKNGRERLAALFGAGYHTVIVSNESALGDPFHDKQDGFFPWLDHCLGVTSKLFEGYTVCPVFIVRDQAALLPSFYMQRLRQGAAYEADEYYRRLSQFDVSWQPVLSKIKAAFPSLVVWPFEDLLPAQSMAATLLGCEDPVLRELLDKSEKISVQNRSASAHAAEIIRRINRASDMVCGRYSSGVKSKLRRSVYKWIESGVRGRKLTVSEGYKAQLQHLYHQDIKRFVKKS